MILNYNHETYNIELQTKDGNYAMLLNGENISFPVNVISDNVFNMQIGNKFENVYCAQDENHFYVSVAGNNFTFAIPKHEEKDFGTDGANLANKEIIKPPMPGSIVKILVEKDQHVDEGTPLIIVEAMKMETTLYSTISGIVTQVNVKASEQVDSDTVLIVVEKEES